MAAALLERETIDADEIKMLIEGKELPPMKSALAARRPTGIAGENQKILKPEGRPRNPASQKANPPPA